jgi:ABC-2 type transport system permease protein
MKAHRMYAIILRNAYFFRHSLDRWTDAFWWPTIDIVTWGLTSVYFQSHANVFPPIVWYIMSGIVLWIFVYRSQYEINVGFLDDIWNKNVINIFVSPITFFEWVVSFICIGIFKVAVTFIFSAALAFILYKLNIFLYGFYLIPFLLLLLMTGIWVSFFVSGLILRYGTRVQSLAWTLLVIILPFSAVYYPVSILPHWAQIIAAITPTSYVFEGMRGVLAHGTLGWSRLLISFGLNCLYMIFTGIYLKKSFDSILQKGLTKVT